MIRFKKFITIIIILATGSIVVPIIFITTYNDYEVKVNLEGLRNMEKVKAKISGEIFDLVVAADPISRQVGFMNVEKIKQNEGMLFVFDKAEIQNFWMKNTYLSLDIIFLDEDFRVITIHKQTEPLNDKKLYSSFKPSRYAIEITGGMSDQINLSIGEIIEIII